MERGYSSKDIGISKFKEKTLKVEHKLLDMKKNTGNFFKKVTDKVKGVYKKWKHNSSNLIDDFI